MSVQVGGSCYADQVSAGPAACAQFAPVSQLTPDGSAVRTVSCASADPQTGALNLQISTAPVDGSAVTTQTIQQVQAFPDCTQQDYVDAGLTLFGAALGLFAAVFPLWALYRWLTTSTRAEMQ